MTPTDLLNNRDAAIRRFGAVIDALHPRETPPAYRLAGQVAWLFAQADRHELPPPEFVDFGNIEWDHCPSIDLSFDSLADLTAWAKWADAVIVDRIGTDGFVGHGFDGAINEVRVKCHYFTREQVSA